MYRFNYPGSGTVIATRLLRKTSVGANTYPFGQSNFIKLKGIISNDKT